MSPASFRTNLWVLFSESALIVPPLPRSAQWWLGWKQAWAISFTWRSGFSPEPHLFWVSGRVTCKQGDHSGTENTPAAHILRKSPAFPTSLSLKYSFMQSILSLMHWAFIMCKSQFLSHSGLVFDMINQLTGCNYDRITNWALLYPSSYELNSLWVTSTRQVQLCSFLVSLFFVIETGFCSQFFSTRKLKPC